MDDPNIMFNEYTTIHDNETDSEPEQQHGTQEIEAQHLIQEKRLDKGKKNADRPTDQSR
jgi:hypothetical protein